MIVSIGSTDIYFPFDEISPEQIQIMFILQKLWKKKCSGIIGIPPAIGLPITVISFYLSGSIDYENHIKLIYLTDTILETQKIFRIIENFYRSSLKKYTQKKEVCFLFSSFLEKKKLCINSDFKKKFKTEELEDLCLGLILPKIKSGKKKVKHKKNQTFEKIPLKYQSCIYFKNYEKKKFKKKFGCWDIKHIRKEAFYKQICPFYFSREVVFESQILVVEFEKFFSTEILGIDVKKIFKNSFTIVESVKNFDSILANLAVSELNLLILNDSLRGLLYLKKKILISYSTNFSYLVDRTSPKKIINFSKIKLSNFRIENFTSINCNEFNVFTEKVLSSKRNLNLIIILKKISEFIHLILNKKIKINTSLDQFINILGNKLKNYQFSSKNLSHFSDYIIIMAFKTSIMDFRFLNGLKYLSWFLLKIGLLLESTNENFRVVTIRQTTSKNLTIEPLLFLCCFELPIFSRILFENSISFLVFTIQNSFLYSNLSILDQDQLYYGNLKLVFRKCFISYQELIFGKNSSKTDFESNFKKNFIFPKKIISTLIQVSESSPNGIICLFSSYTILLEVIKNLNNPDTLRQIKICRNIFVEILFCDLDEKILEDYKLSCDLGIKSIFFGLSRGIITKTNIENHYSRFILKIQTKLIFLNKFKKVYYILQRFPFSHFSFSNLIENENYNDQTSISRKFFGSKKDYGIFLRIKQVCDFKKNSKESKFEIIRDQKIIKEEGLSTTHKIDQYFRDYSNYNIGS